MDDENYMKKELLDLKKKYDKMQLERMEEQRKVEGERFDNSTPPLDCIPDLFLLQENLCWSN